MAEIFDKEIETYQTELTEVVGKMEDTRQAFLSAAAACLKQWFDQKARFYVQDQYWRTHQLGPQHIAEMKRRVTELVVATPTLTQQVLDDVNLWWHKSRGGGWTDQYAAGPPEPMQKAVSQVASRLEAILIAYGYLAKDSQPEAVGEDSGNDGENPKQERPVLDWSEDMIKTIELYKEQLGRATYLDSKVDATTKLKKKYEAGALWDQA